MRAMASTGNDGAQAAAIDAGTARAVPSSSIALRPCRSPSAPSHSTDAARPSE